MTVCRGDTIQIDAKGKTRQQSGEGKDRSQGPIAQLQEFVQESGKSFTIPSSCPVLQWGFESRARSAALEFRATVAFILDGVPHHVAGVWQPAKKAAQRDAAERALGLYAKSGREFSEVLKREESSRSVCWADWADDTDEEPDSEEDEEVHLLRDFCFNRGSHPPVYSRKTDGGKTQAFVEVRLRGVAHTFCGQFCKSPELAERDVARRVLWYFGASCMEGAFELDPEHVRRTAQGIPEPSTNWVKASSSEKQDKQLAERKTLMMRAQNRIQQVFARRLLEGQSVWQWRYERNRSSEDKVHSLLHRAIVHVPVADQSFVSDWMQGQREAQLDACQKIMDLLEAEPPRTRS
jgi:dsRNA-specific ribonuclease